MKKTIHNRIKLAVGATAFSLTLIAPGVASASEHYDTNSGQGGTMVVNTPTCNGGGLNTSANWANRIDKSFSNCWAYHYDGANYLNFMQKTGAGLNVFLNVGNRDRTDSLKYFAS